MDEAVRRGLPGWYEEAMADAEITPVGDPKLDLEDLPAKGAPLAFTIEVGVVPPAQLGDYKGLEVGRREPSADPDQVQGGARAPARIAGRARDRRAPGGHGRLRGHGLQRLDRR